MNGLRLSFTPRKLVWFCFGACQWLGEKDSKQLNIGWWMLGYPLWCSVYTQTDRQTDRQADRQTGRQTDRQSDR